MMGNQEAHVFMQIADWLGHALRPARTRPAFAFTVVLILGLGIGATTAAVNVATSVLSSPLAIEDDARVLLISKTLADGSVQVPFSLAELTAWAEASRALDGVAGVQYDGAWTSPLEFEGLAFPVFGTTVSGNFFEVLGAEPAVGRLLSAQDALAGAESVAVIGYGIWRRQFGASPAIVGQRVRLNGRDTTIVGVAPTGFEFPKRAELWQPLVATPDVLNEGWFNLVARLEPDATRAHATEEVAGLLERLRSVSFSSIPNLRTTVVPFREAIVGNVRPVMGLFVTAAFLIFLVGCINVMNLLLVRAAAREREISIYAALGATRVRLLGQLLAENLAFACGGGLLGALIAYWLQRALVAWAPAGLPRIDQIGFHGRALGLAIAASALGAVLAGVLPACWATHRALFRGLRRPSSPGGQRTRQLLVAAQLAFALMVSVAAALMVRSLQHLQAAELGFHSDRLSILQVPLVGGAYRDPERRQHLFDQLIARLRATPGVASATAVLQPPFTGTAGWDATVTPELRSAGDAGANASVHLEAVLPSYFPTMRVAILEGRDFADSDRKGSLPVAVVSESLARRSWPGSSPVGKRLKFGSADSPTPWMTVVGIVRDLRYRDLQSPPPTVYVPVRQFPFPARYVVVRANLESAPVLSMTQRALRDVDPNEPVVEMFSIDELRTREMADPRFHMSALVLFAAIAVLLAALGVFVVLGAFVAQRSREVALRVALGANPIAVRRLVLSQVGWPAALGLTAGTSVALAVTPALQPLLFHVNAFDGRAFAAGWIVLLAASLLAAVVPVRRALVVDPATLLRLE